MKILVVASTFPRWAGDLSAPFVYLLSSGLANKGHEVHVLAPHSPGSASKERMGPVQVHRFHYSFTKSESLAYGGGIVENLRLHPFRWILVPSFLTSQLISVIKLVRRYNIEVIHAHWALPQGLLAVLSRLLIRRPVIITTHAADVLALRGGLKRWLLRKTICRASACTAVSSATGSLLEQFTGRAPLIIPMGVDTSRFKKTKAAITNGSRILFVGRLAEKKGLEYLLHAMPYVRDTFPKTELVIAGDGPERAKLVQISRQLEMNDTVQFVGAIPNNELPQYYNSADVLVMPSIVTRDGDTEGLPVVLLEAASSNLPIVASNVGGIPDVIRHEETGLLVDPMEPHQLAQAIVRVLVEKELSNTISSNARLHVVANFSWESVVNRFESLLNRHSKHL